MKLCRTVTLSHDRKLIHAVCPLAHVETAARTILAGPVKLSFDSYRLAALVDEAENLSPDFQFDDDIAVTWSVLITEQMDKKPLINNMSPLHALHTLGEVISNVYEGFALFEHRLLRVVPHIVTNHVTMSYVIEKGSYARMAIGAALCLSTMLSGVLFVRGLNIASSSVSFADEGKLGRLDFINLYRYVLTDIYGH